METFQKNVFAYFELNSYQYGFDFKATESRSFWKYLEIGSWYSDVNSLCKLSLPFLPTPDFLLIKPLLHFQHWEENPPEGFVLPTVDDDVDARVENQEDVGNDGDNLAPKGTSSSSSF